MKKRQGIKILAVFVGLVLTSFFCLQGGVKGEDYWDDPYGLTGASTSKKECAQQQCPYTKMTEKCLTCHLKGKNFKKIREFTPHEAYDYPNLNTKIIDGIGFYQLQDINSDKVDETFKYFARHGIKKVIIEIHSPGGSLFEAWRIIGTFRYWKNRGVLIETRCYGFAASAGFMCFIAGTKGHRFVSSTAELMWHELMSLTFFKIETPSSKEDEARVLRHLQNTANAWVASRSNLKKEEIDELVRKQEYWINGADAVKAGFADGFL